jgi:hypothetical protein
MNWKQERLLLHFWLSVTANSVLPEALQPNGSDCLSGRNESSCLPRAIGTLTFTWFLSVLLFAVHKYFFFFSFVTCLFSSSAFLYIRLSVLPPLKL